MIFSLRMKIPFTKAPPNTAENFIHPSTVQYSEQYIMEEMLVIETPPMLRVSQILKQPQIQLF